MKIIVENRVTLNALSFQVFKILLLRYLFLKDASQNTLLSSSIYLYPLKFKIDNYFQVYSFRNVKTISNNIINIFHIVQSFLDFFIFQQIHQ